MKDGGHSDGKSKKCGTLRRGLLDLFPGEGMTFGEHIPDSVDCMLEEVIWACRVGVKSG